MKYAVFAASLFLSLQASAVSMEEVWAKQEQITVSPVRAGELHLVGTPAQAVLACASMGYIRMVKHELEGCDSSDDRLAILREYVAVGIEPATLRCPSNLKRLKSVTCAR